MRGQSSNPSTDDEERTAFRTRRGVAVALVIALLVALAGCGGDDDASSATTETSGDRQAATTAAGGQAATRTVETEMGAVEIPADPQHIVALDEYAAMNMLALGIEPALVYGSYQSEISQEVLTAAGIEVTDASVQTGINFEAVAAEAPDLIVFTAEPAFMENYEQLSAVAPTVVLPYNQPWRDAIRSTATTFDRSAEGDHLIGALEGRIDEVAAGVGTDPISISLLGDIMDMLFAVSNKAPLSALLDEVGFTRPTAQADGTPFEGYESIIVLSAEVLAEHDADVVAVFSGIDYNAEAVTSLPTFQALPAVAAGRSFEIDGGMWFGTFPFAVYWILEDLAALFDGASGAGGAGGAGPGTVDDTAQRWSGFQALTG